MRKCFSMYVEDSFPTAIGYSSDGGVDLLDNAHTFSCKTLGGIGKDILIDCNELPIKADDNYSKDTDLNRICTMYAIAKHVIPGETVNISVGCPLTIYMNKEKRTEYGLNIPNGKIECVIDDKPIEFVIAKRLVCAESTGILSVHPELFNTEDYDAAIIDIGGLNMNITAVNNSNIIIESSHTYMLGGRILFREIWKSFMDCGLEITDSQILKAIKRGYVDYHDSDKKEQSGVIIRQAVNKFVDEIVNSLHKSWSSFDSLELFFIGGTSFLLKEQLTERFGDHARFESNLDDSRFCNSRGFALKMYQKLTR